MLSHPVVVTKTFRRATLKKIARAMGLPAEQLDF
jgi:hypothetical protein